jgi:hypothetical protein
MDKVYRLSKSRLMSYLQCPKRLYLETHRPVLIEYSAATQASFEVGHTVGAVARNLFGAGHLIAPDNNLTQALAITRALLEENGNEPLYEATFQQDGVLVRADVLLRGESALDLIEVKASASLKEQHVPDCAIQAAVIEGAGYPLRKVSLAHINTDFVYEREGDYDDLLSLVEITDQVRALAPQVKGWAEQATNMLAGDVPDIQVGPHCHKPYDCPLLSFCTPQGPEYPISVLRSKKLEAALSREGYRDLREVPRARLDRHEHLKIWQAAQTGEAIVDQEGSEKIRQIPYPRYYLDFETISFAVPIWLGTSPHQALPFQFSCHIEHAPGQLTHKSYLGTGDGSPIREIAQALLDCLGKQGPILIYTTYEKGCIKTLAELCPDLASGLVVLNERMVDLHPIMKAHYYHRDMQGSWSIKKLLPTLAPDLSYSALGEIREGMGASAAFAEMLQAETTKERKQSLQRDLEAYCELDTLAMVRIVDLMQSRHTPGAR